MNKDSFGCHEMKLVSPYSGLLISSYNLLLIRECFVHFCHLFKAIYNGCGGRHSNINTLRAYAKPFLSLKRKKIFVISTRLLI